MGFFKFLAFATSLNIIFVFFICPTFAAHSHPLKVGLQRHNSYRALHEATPPLHFSSNISLVSQRWAEKLLKEKSFVHSKNSGYGENLWTCYGCKYGSEEAVRKAVDSWYGEIKLYNWNHPGFTSETGHFTALIWKSATRLGIGIARDTKRIVVVANYSPITNIVGQFRTNVKPKK